VIRVTSAVHINNYSAAVKIAAEITNLVKTKHRPKSIDVLIDRFSTGVRRLCWYVDFDDIAHLKRWQAELAKDSAYVGLLAKAKKTGAFIKNTQHHTFQSSI